MGSADRKPSLEAPSLGFRRRRKDSPSVGEESVADQPALADEDVRVGADSARPVVDDVPALADDAEPPVAEGPAVADVAALTADPEPSVVSTSGGPTVVQAPVERAEAPQARPRRRTLGPVNGHVAAAVAGGVVAVFLVAATLGGLQACRSVRGTPNCGGGPGFFLLLLIVVVAVVIGAFVLRAAEVPGAGSISFLAVALVSVVSVLFLLDVLDQLSGAVVVGLVTVASYLLAHWVTVRYLDAVE